MPFPRSTWPDTGKPGRMRYTLADSPGVGGNRDISCRKGQAPSLRGGACEFARSCGKRGHCCAERRGRRSLPGVCEFAEGGIKPFPCAAGAVEDASPYSCAATNARHPFPFPSGGRWHPPIPREADDGRGRTSPLADGKTVAFPRGWRSFPHYAPAVLSLSGRPCGRHPPPLGEGPGEGTLVVSPGTVLIDNFFPREAQNLSSRTLPTSATREPPRFLSAAFPCQFPQDSL